MNSATEGDKVMAVVLAAGCSRRFGKQDKRIAQLPDGRGLLAATVSRASEAFPLLHVVLREEDDPISLGLSATTPIVRVTRAEYGLGASLGEAITALSRDTALPGVEAIAILLGDMPYTRLETLFALRGLATQASIIRPYYEGQPGHPVLFGRDFWQELVSLDGEEGAKAILQRYPSLYNTLEIEDPGVCRDIDNLEDLDPYLVNTP